MIDMHLILPKNLKLPKIRVKLQLRAMLWVVLVCAILVEVGVLYRYLRLNSQKISSLPAENAPKTIRINTPLYEEVSKWLEENAAYGPPSYQLQRGGVGRANPFAEY